MSESDKHKHPPESADTAATRSRPLLGIQIPHQSTPRPGHFLLDEKQTADWFDALPMANIGETARRIYNLLVEFNRTEISDLLRARTVERFRPPVEYISKNLQKYYIDVGLPLPAKGWKTACLALELHKELAISYKVIIERMISGDSSNFDRRLLVIVLHRALTYLGQTLLQNALTYTSWPAGTWREINSIYAYASQNNVHLVPVKPDDSKNGRSTTIEDIFKSLMLFASATPHRLRQSHAMLLFAQLLEWSSYTEILSNDDGGTSLGRFNVDLWADSAPMHNSLRTPVPGKRIAILDVRELLKKLRSDFEQAPWDSRGSLHSGSPMLTRPLLRLLIMAWSRPPDRRYVRTRLNFDLQVVAGLHAIHANLHAEEDPPYTPTRAALYTLEESDPPRHGRKRQIQWGVGSLENVTLAPLDSDFVSDSMFTDSQFGHYPFADSTSNLTEFADQSEGQDHATEESEHHTVRTINESAGGYCIRWQGANIPRVKIGEVIGVQSPTDRRRYGLGVIRWMKQLAEGSLDLGLEVIATRCAAAELREAGKNQARSRTPAYRCLVINDTDPASNATASLVMHAITLKTGTDLQLDLGGNEQVIRLTRLVEFSSAFARYQFEFVHHEDGTAGDDRPRGDDFSDLWSSL